MEFSITAVNEIYNSHLLNVENVKNEDIKTITFKISENFIKELDEVGFKIIKKLGEGHQNIGLLCLNSNNKKYVLLIEKNWNCVENNDDDNYNDVKKLQDKNIINNEYMIILYDTIIIESKLSNDIEFCKNLIDTRNFVKIQEYGKQSFDELLIHYKEKSFDEKVLFLIKLHFRLIEMQSYFISKGLYYMDLNVGNLVLRKNNNLNTLIFIDISSFNIFDYTLQKDIFIENMKNEEYEYQEKDEENEKKYYNKKIESDIIEFIKNLVEKYSTLFKNHEIKKAFDKYCDTLNLKI
jgi:hypothetical protein